MSRKTLGFILVALGVIVLIVALFADAFGIGEGTAFGWKQILGSIVGALVALAGLWLATRKVT